MSHGFPLWIARICKRILQSIGTDDVHVNAARKLVIIILSVPVFGFAIAVMRLWTKFAGPVTVVTGVRGQHEVRCEFPDYVQTYLYMFGIWEPDITRYVESILAAGDGFIDVGAYVGYYPLIVFPIVGSKGCVVAIEASQQNFEALTRNLDLNGNPMNVRTVHAAVSNSTGRATIYQGPRQNLGLSTTVSTRGLEGCHDIEAFPLNALASKSELQQARFIKVDVEGGEVTVLSSVLSVLDDCRGDVELIVELSPQWWPNQELKPVDVLKGFIELGFNVYEIPNNYWPWRYLWPNHTARPARVDHSTLTDRVRRLDLILSRKDLAIL